MRQCLFKTKLVNGDGSIGALILAPPSILYVNIKWSFQSASANRWTTYKEGDTGINYIILAHVGMLLKHHVQQATYGQKTALS